jgi:hypothetical protein
MEESRGVNGRRGRAAGAGLALLAAGAVAAVAAAGEEKPWVVPVSLRVDAVEVVLQPGDRASRYAFEGGVSGLLALPGGKGEVRLLLSHDRPAEGASGRGSGSGSFLSEWRIGLHRDAQGLTLYPRSGRDLLRKVSVPRGEKRSAGEAALDGLSAPFPLSPSGESLLVGERRGGRALEVRGGEARVLSGLGRWPREGFAVLGGTDSPFILSLGGAAETPGGRVFLFAPEPGPQGTGFSLGERGSLLALEMEGGAGEETLRTRGRRIPVRWVPLSQPPDSPAKTGGPSGTAFSCPRAALPDPRNPGKVYLLTGGDERRGPTGRPVNHNGRLYLLALDSPQNPRAGGTLEVVLSGTEGPAGPSCLAALPDGSLLLGEAPAFPLPGREASLWRLDPRSGDLTRLLEVSPAAVGEGAEPGEWGITAAADASPFLGSGWIFVVVGGPAFGEGSAISQILAVHLQ